MREYNKSTYHNNSLEKIIVGSFVCAMVFYLLSITLIQGYNVSLQNKEQQLAKQINETREEIDQMKLKIDTLEEKSRVVSLLGDDIQDNSDNIYYMSE